MSSKKLVHSAPLSGAPINMVSGDASRKSRMLYTISGEAGRSTSGYESRDFEVVPFFHISSDLLRLIVEGGILLAVPEQTRRLWKTRVDNPQH
jgi:hypothetical protein